MSLANLLRILALSTSAVILTQTTTVLYVYALAWKRSPHVRGIIPRYVVGVALYATLVEITFIGVAADFYQRGHILNWYGPMILAANVDLMISLAFIFRYDRRRISAANPVHEPDQVPLRRAEDFAPPTSRWWGRLAARSGRH